MALVRWRGFSVGWVTRIERGGLEGTTLVPTLGMGWPRRCATDLRRRPAMAVRGQGSGLGSQSGCLDQHRDTALREARLGSVTGITQMAGVEPRPRLFPRLAARSRIQSAAGRAGTPVHTCTRHACPERRDRPDRRRPHRALAGALSGLPSARWGLPETAADP